MTEKIHFTIQSPENFVRLCATILFEKDEQELERIGYAWHNLLDTDDGENLFKKFIDEVLPLGGMIGEPEIIAIKNKAIQYLDTNENALEFQANYDKKRYDSWVYFKPYHKVYQVGFCKHREKAEELLFDFFNGIDDYDFEKFKRFIKENFEVCSENTSVESLVKDADWMLRNIILGNRISKYEE